MTEKKGTAAKVRKPRKKAVKKPIEVADKVTMEELVNAIKPVKEVTPEVAVTPEPTLVNVIEITKDYKINFKKITTVMDVVGLLKALDVVYRVDPNNIAPELKVLIDTKHIKEV